MLPSTCRSTAIPVRTRTSSASSGRWRRGRRSRVVAADLWHRTSGRSAEGASPVALRKRSSLLTKLILSDRRGAVMRWLHILLVALFAVGTFVFLIQNFEIVTLSFLGFSARTRL